jgi:fructose transport system ATP-binding protein
MSMDLGTDTSAVEVKSATPTLEARGLVKTFGHVVGLAGVDLQLYPGEVLAIIGDNGAGKSTLIGCLSGALAPDEGEILVDGVRVDFKSPLDARRAGIETVFQNLAVAPALDIASNLYLGRETRRKGLLGTLLRSLDARGMRDDADSISRRWASPRSRTCLRRWRPCRAGSARRSRWPAPPGSALR